MMDPITLRQAASWAGGEASGSGDVLVGPDVVIDSRRVTPGCLFVALPGERVDGHDYVADAAASGAAAALVTRRLDVALPQIVVADGVAGLSALARGVVARAEAETGLVVVGVTGSSGKTSTKDLIAQVLGASGPTVAPVGSFNNEIGAPLTALRVDAATRFLVSEMGSRGIGHIADLCTITPPVIGAVLNVGHAHVGEFGSVEVIAQAKGELVEAVGVDGWAVLNADDERVAAMASRTSARLALFSTVGDPGPDAALRVWASDVAAGDLQRYAFTLHAAGATSGSASVRLRVLGEHQVANALAAAAVALAAGLDVASVADALTRATAQSRWRMELAERADGLALLNDAYNANPDSMAAALRALAGLRRPGGRIVAALGDMLELGPDAADAHREVGRLAAEVGVDELAATGEFAAAMIDGFAGAGRPASVFASASDMAEHLRALAGPRDVVLVKASRGLALDRVAASLLDDSARDEGAQP